MIKEYKKNIKKCHNCSTIWTFNDDDVQQRTAYDEMFDEDYIKRFIRCPKCNTYLELYNDKGIYR